MFTVNIIIVFLSFMHVLAIMTMGEASRSMNINGRAVTIVSYAN